MTRCGFVPEPGMYYEVVGEPTVSPHPWVMIHGGGATGACFRVTPDGRPGWAERLAEAGYQCWTTDWPGSGRSGGIDPLEVDYDTLIDGYEALLRDTIGVPCTIVCHSMGGAVAWKLVERARPLVAGVIALAASYPGNIGPAAQIVSDDGASVVLRHPDSGVEFTVRRDAPYLYSDAYIEQQGISTSTHFPREHVADLRASLVGIAPKLTLSRLGADGGLPCVERTETFEGLWVRDVIGTEDPAHTPEIEQRTVDLLRSWGADAELMELAGHGIAGNGHFLYAERNSDEVLRAVLDELERRPAATS